MCWRWWIWRRCAAIRVLGGEESKVNPLSPVDLGYRPLGDGGMNMPVSGLFADNVAIEMSRNNERYRFLRWGQQAFDRFRAVPPGTGIRHQVNLEYLGKSVWYETRDGKTYAYPGYPRRDRFHTTMINGPACWASGRYRSGKPRCSDSRCHADPGCGRVLP